MNRTCFALGFILAALSVVAACGRDRLPESAFPVLKGPYLGQKTPGAVAQLFAPGIVSTGMSERRLAISPDGKDILYEQAAGRIVTIMETRLEDGRWTEPAVPSFAADLDHFYFEPAFTPDGKTVLFLCTRPRAGQTDKPGWGNQAIWAADRGEHGSWSAPRDLGAPVNTDAGEFYPSLTNGGTLYFTQAGVSGGNPKVMRARRTGDRYAEPEPLPEAINGHGPTYNACVAPDETYLIACREEKGGGGKPEGTRYLVFFRSPDGRWSEGVDPGPAVNLPGGEANAPALTPDGRYLFFGSTASSELRSQAPAALTSRRLLAFFSGPQNGGSDIYWIDTSVIGQIRERVQK